MCVICLLFVWATLGLSWGSPTLGLASGGPTPGAAGSGGANAAPDLVGGPHPRDLVGGPHPRDLVGGPHPRDLVGGPHPRDLVGGPHPRDLVAWDVSAPHGPVHPVEIDVTEGTWLDVTVHGDRLVFSLLGDLWGIPLAGGEAQRLTEGPAWDVQPRFSPDGTRLAFTSDRGGNENIWIAHADGTDPEPFTEEEVARCTDPVWDSSGPYLLFRRRTVDTRSIGVTEIWQRHLDGGDGFALTEIDEHPHAADPASDGRHLWFASRHGRFDYDESAVAGLWDVVRLDRLTGDQRVVVRGGGSASRPLLDPARQRLYFVSRERERTLLERLDLRTGRRDTIADWLSPDELEAFALHGTYPSMALTGAGEIVLWAGGKLWRLDPDSGRRAEIPFHVRGTWTVADVRRWPVAIDDQVRATVVRWPTLSARGSWAFSALGALWVRTPDGKITRIGDGTGYAPAWSPDGTELAWTSWDDEAGGALHVTNPRGITEPLPVSGQLTNPAWSEDGQELVVLRGAGGGLPGEDLARESWYEVVHLVRERGRWSVAHRAPLDGAVGDRPTAVRLQHPPQGGPARIWSVEFREEEAREPEVAVVRSMAVDGTDRIDHLRLGAAEQAVISPQLDRVAFVRDHHLWVTALPPFARGVEVDALPVRRLTRLFGDWLGFTPDGRSLTWAEGPVLSVGELTSLSETPGEGNTEGDAPLAAVAQIPIELVVPRARPEGALVLENARVLPMAPSPEVVLDRVNVVIERDRIVEIGAGATRAGATVVDCSGKTVIPGLIDVHAHLHFASTDILPEQEWRYLTALDFGVTTLHDPSARTDVVFTQQQRVAAGWERGPRVYSTGQILYGALGAFASETPTPEDARRHVQRLAAVGATSVKVYQQSQRDRRQWYVQACREQRMLCVPEGGGDLWMDLTMVVDGYHSIEHALPESPLYADVIALFAGSGGGAGSESADGLGTFYTPTLLVAYGGLQGKNWFIQHENPVDDPRIRRHTPTRWLESHLWRWPMAAQASDWRFRSTAQDTARLREAGVRVTLGAHGELQGLGVHWELWSLGGSGAPAGQAALTPAAALAAGTIEGARYLGLERDLGSIEVGRLADLVILNRDPLADLQATADIHMVVQNGNIVAAD
jgi:imidazolonepropionase-like amidohydrolase